MNLEELEKKRAYINKNTDITMNNLQILSDESKRVADIAHCSEKILNGLDEEFERSTGLKGQDIRFLFIAIGLQVMRILLTNYLTTIEPAGTGNKMEERLHEIQNSIFTHFNGGGDTNDKLFYASLNHIISTPGVPYDATSFLTKKQIEKLSQNSYWNFDINELIQDNNGMFRGNPGVSGAKGANHRFSTLGHDPQLGLLFGTVNILTNTITSVGTPLLADEFNIPKIFTSIKTNHVVYTAEKITKRGVGHYTDPRISIYAPTTYTIYQAMDRVVDQPEALVAALIKQVIHIGTDMFTPAGIQLPAANLILSKDKVEQITKYIGEGDIVKTSISARVAKLINSIISAFHTLTFDPNKEINSDIHSVKTKKIILYSNIIATSSNVVWIAVNMASGNEMAIKNIDIGGLITIFERLSLDQKFIRSVKEEFVIGEFNEMIQGEELSLGEVQWL